MELRKNVWAHVIASQSLMFIFFIIFFLTYYIGGKEKTITATFITFTIILIISFISYRSNYRAVPSRRMIRKYKNDREQFAIDRKNSGRIALLIVLTYLPLNLITLGISLLINYI